MGRNDWNTFRSNLGGAAPYPPGDSKYYMFILYWMYMPHFDNTQSDKLSAAAHLAFEDIFHAQPAEKYAQLTDHNQSIKRLAYGASVHPSIEPASPNQETDASLAQETAVNNQTLRGIEAPGRRYLGITSWGQLLAQLGRFTGVKVFTTDIHRLDIVRRTLGQPVLGSRVRLKEHFYFSIDAPISGRLLAVQGYQEKWYPLDLTGQHLKPGSHTLPDLTKAEVEFFTEDADVGIHSFVFVITDSTDFFVFSTSAPSDEPSIPPRELDLFASIVGKPNLTTAVLRANVIFVP